MINFIEKENWKDAEGIDHREGETNPAFAQRNYDIKCRIPYSIAVINGYHIWWCSAHHQPLAWCENAKLQSLIDNNALVILNQGNNGCNK